MSDPAPGDARPSVELLESVHQFPGTYIIKAIGRAEDDFPTRVVTAALGEIAVAGDLQHHVRHTTDGRHVSVTLEIIAQSAEQVRSLYSRIQAVPGLTLLL